MYSAFAKNTALTLALSMAASSAANAHFQMLIPSDDMVKQGESRQLMMDALFWHPYEGKGMPMEKPVQFGVMVNGQKTDLRAQLKANQTTDLEGKKFPSFKLEFPLKRPGDHTFYIEPAPYWEAAEESFIIHYTKVIVNSFGLEEGWDQPVGLKTEIVPLTRPYGLYTNNVFQGKVLVNGKPVANSTVEIEYYNKDGKLKPIADPMITQVIKTDSNGVFTYAMPKQGWWGFAALNEDSKKMKHDGKDYPVEIGAVLWVKTHDMK
ncbi:MAG: DUF4198 domain-containing protein [Gammaproteobacteria bacterium]|nr:DUF4198 domain-containing protein [Gammaproteobacteria bacterium]